MNEQPTLRGGYVPTEPADENPHDDALSDDLTDTASRPAFSRSRLAWVLFWLFALLLLALQLATAFKAGWGLDSGNRYWLPPAAAVAPTVATSPAMVAAAHPPTVNLQPAAPANQPTGGWWSRVVQQPVVVSSTVVAAFPGHVKKYIAASGQRYLILVAADGRHSVTYTGFDIGPELPQWSYYQLGWTLGKLNGTTAPEIILYRCNTTPDLQSEGDCPDSIRLR